LVIAFGFLFNIINSYLNGRYIFTFSSQYTVEWLFDFRFILGVFIFLTGFAVNLWADYTMKRQKSTSKAYVIPYGGLYHWISCPNYLGEIIEWIGWAIMTWSLPGLAFALWTIANLVPRSRANHKWYISHFPDYPDTRRALLPKLW
jgi:protein-S-isoprenylcysteine O-methyltransferase Ste14